MGPAFEVFHEQQVHQVSQAAGDLNFSFVVDEEQAPRLTRKLHAQFFGKREPDALIGPDWRELMEGSGKEPASRAAWWQGRREDLLAIAARNESGLRIRRRHAAGIVGTRPVDRGAGPRILFR